jgi:putative endonuclease
MEQHYNGMGANYTYKRFPVKLLYIEKFDRIDLAFNREKQIQGWSHRKKKALIERNIENLKLFAKSYSALEKYM